MERTAEDTIATAFHFLELSASGQLRDIVLRLKMEARRSLLLTLKGSATAYLGASFAVASLIPTLGWWVGLLCLPLSIAGSVHGRRWRDLTEHWEAPIVIDSYPLPKMSQEKPDA